MSKCLLRGANLFNHSILRGIILMSVRIFPEMLSQIILVGFILVGRFGVVHDEYTALAKKTSVLREAMLLFLEPWCFGVNDRKVVRRRVCRHLLKPC